MTATRDELIKAGEGASFPWPDIVVKYSTKTEVIKILNLHFSTTEEERKEAVEWVNWVLKDEPEINIGNIPQPIKTVLRALGEPE